MASIRQQPSGSWRVYWRDPAGRQRARHFRTKREAREFKAQIELELARGSYVDSHAAGRVLFRDYAAGWLAGRTVERASAARDESLLRVHVLARWGGLPLPKIDHIAVQQWIAELGGRLAPATVRECYRVLSLILRSAVQARLLAINPCDGVRLPPKRRGRAGDAQPRGVTGKLLPEIPDRYRALVATSAYTGLRWGECVGLYWKMIHLDSRRLRVVRVLAEVSGQITVKPFPKSRAGRRTVPLPAALAAMLVEHGQTYPSPQLVFTNSIGGPVGRTSFRTRIWKPAIKRAGLPARLRFHDLRHSYATWLVSDGVPPNIVQRIMGHEDVTTTLSIYTDVPGDYVDRVDSVFDDSVMTDEDEDGAS